MTDLTKYIQDKLERTQVTVEKKELEQVCKDRIDFGFDSIYFRYAEVCDELAAYKVLVDRKDPIQARREMNHRKMHFYQALEQLLHAHEDEEHNEA